MIKYTSNFAAQVDFARAKTLLAEIQDDVMGGWFDLPLHPNQEELVAIKQAAQQIQADSKYLICIGIGGSYLGHRALIDALHPQSPTKILYAGNSLSSHALQAVLDELGDADFSINVISKSGTTTEPAVAFRILKNKLIAKYGSAASTRIYATTDATQGALHDEAVAEGYTRFVVPDNIGGRYSVLSAVGLLPLAVAGVDIAELLAGAADERRELEHPEASSALNYAFTRAKLRDAGHDVEILATFEPELHEFSEWWKQLFGESEGKDGQGIFPAAVTYTTDLHSLGQYLQDGRRNIFETMLRFEKITAPEVFVPQTIDNADGLSYLEGQSLAYLNNTALEATLAAHRDGGIPVGEVIAPDLSARSCGALVFFFELACAVSAKLAGVNPFDQPGVEAYKTNMFHLLGKPGYC